MASELFKVTGENWSWQGSSVDWLFCPTDKDSPSGEVIFSWHRAEVFDGDIKVHIDSLCEIVRVKYDTVFTNSTISYVKRINSYGRPISQFELPLHRHPLFLGVADIEN